MSKNNQEIEKLIETLSPIERKIVPFLNLPPEKIAQEAELDEVSLTRALKFLEAKKVLDLSTEKKESVELGVNGIYYKKNHLPERVLLTTIESKNHVTLEEAKKISKLSENEFKVSLGILKGKNLISLANGKISLAASKTEHTKKFLEEQILELLPSEKENIPIELLPTLDSLRKRKEIIEIKQITILSIQLTNLGKEIAGKEIKLDLIEEVTSEVIRDWKPGKRFRKYDIHASVPKIYGGKKHFVNQSIEYGKQIWFDLGFKEMSGNLTTSSFWNFDALFQPQDHPSRDMHDTFFIKEIREKLPDNEIVKKIKQSHESGLDKSLGLQYNWKEEEAEKLLLRTHTTCLTAKTLASLKKSDIPSKFFAIGKVFRNETIDWKHGFEFNQTEGIVVDRNLNLRHLLGYLKEFYKKMGFEKVRFTPSFFPYTEPSVEISVWNNEKNSWIEFGGAGILRPEVTIPLLGEKLPVLAWGQGFDRIIMDYYKIRDLRELYANDINKLRTKKAWMKL